MAVVGYLAGGALCLWQRKRATLPRARLFWLLAGLAVLALCINKQFDLQTPFTAWGRQIAQDDGWYADRRAVQKTFIKGVTILALTVSLATAWAVRGLGRRVHVVLVGLSLLALFVMVRAASFHHVDVALRQPVLEMRLYMVLELVGISIIIAGAAWPARRRRG